MSAFACCLPGLPPPANHLYPTAAHGRRVLSDAARAWRDGAVLGLQAAATYAGTAFAPHTPLEVTAIFVLPRLYTRDLDGCLKALADAISAATGVDDRYIVRWVVAKERGPVAETRVRVAAATAEQAGAP